MDQIDRLEKQIDKTRELLSEWEDKRFTAENPSEKSRCEIEIKHLKAIIHSYETELSNAKPTPLLQNPTSQIKAHNIHVKGARNIIINTGTAGDQEIKDRAISPSNFSADINKQSSKKNAIIAIIILNIIALSFAVYWSYGKQEPEPIISSITLLATLITLLIKLRKKGK